MKITRRQLRLIIREMAYKGTPTVIAIGRMVGRWVQIIMRGLMR
jgi:hypothetical protein